MCSIHRTINFRPYMSACFGSGARVFQVKCTLFINHHKFAEFTAPKIFIIIFLIRVGAFACLSSIHGYKILLHPMFFNHYKCFTLLTTVEPVSPTNLSTALDGKGDKFDKDFEGNNVSSY